MKVIDNSGIKKVHSNGGRIQNILLEHNENTFKIDINSESYEKQSYAKLYVLNSDKKWTLLKAINPLRDYNIDISYRENFSQDSFKSIIQDFKSLIKKLNI